MLTPTKRVVVPRKPAWPLAGSGGTGTTSGGTGVSPITPYLVVPFGGASDTGKRPILGPLAFPLYDGTTGIPPDPQYFSDLATSQAIRVTPTDVKGNPIGPPLNQALGPSPPYPPIGQLKVGGKYLIQITVRNLGPAPCYSGIAEFSVNPFDNPSLQYAITNFAVAAGDSVTVNSPKLLNAAARTNKSNFQNSCFIFVRAYDPFHDPLIYDPVRTDSWDYLGNRHISRVDFPVR
jgi:hypothetical protein